MFLYETDEDKPVLGRIFRALCYEIFLIIIVIVLSFIVYGSMKKANYCQLYYT